MKDENYIKETINCYLSNDFEGMTNLIIDYPASDFFYDLFEHLNSYKFNSENNKLLMFTGVTIQFSKIISKYLQDPF